MTAPIRPYFNDHAAAIDEPKTARMEQRTKPHVQAQIQRAAALLGIDEATFRIRSGHRHIAFDVVG